MRNLVQESVYARMAEGMITDEQHGWAAHLQKTIGERFLDAIYGAAEDGVPESQESSVIGATAASLLMYAQKHPGWAVRVIAGALPETVSDEALERMWQDLEL